MLVHVDDILMTGQMDEIEKLFADLQAAMKLREEGRLERPGDKAQFLGRRLRMTDREGLRLRKWDSDRAHTLGATWT